MPHHISPILSQSLDALWQNLGIQSQNQDFSLFVGLSGGLDSVVLLDLLIHSPQRPKNCAIKALHVHHGLSANADAWLQFCQQLCQNYAIDFISERVTVGQLSQQGVENQARQARWQVFAEYVQSSDFLCLAQHQDDQCETLMLNLLRGCGVSGGKAMQSDSERLGFRVLRPLLAVSKAELRTYAEQQQLQWVDDESNANEIFSRNYLRHQVMPKLEERWPGYRQNLYRFTEHMATTESLLDQLAVLDLQAFSTQPAMAATQVPLTLHWPSLQGLTAERRINLLRYFLQHHPEIRVNYLPSSQQLAEWARQIGQAKSGQQIELAWDSLALRQQGENIQLQRVIENESLIDLTWHSHWPCLDAPLDLPDGTQLLANCQMAEVKTEASAEHSDFPRLAVRAPENHEPVSVRFRQGGERCRPHYRQHSTSLKKIYQELQVPEAKRQSIPLVYYGEQLVAAVGVFYVAEFLANSPAAIVFQLSD